MKISDTPPHSTLNSKTWHVCSQVVSRNDTIAEHVKVDIPNDKILLYPMFFLSFRKWYSFYFYSLFADEDNYEEIAKQLVRSSVST